MGMVIRQVQLWLILHKCKSRGLPISSCKSIIKYQLCKQKVTIRLHHSQISVVPHIHPFLQYFQADFVELSLELGSVQDCPFSSIQSAPPKAMWATACLTGHQLSQEVTQSQTSELLPPDKQADRSDKIPPVV